MLQPQVMEEIFGRDGLIARRHEQYEYRPGQIAMAEAVAKAFASKRHLLVEAGTGTGKTLAYLVPAVATGKRIIISTGTKNLQEQLFKKDIPFLQSVLPSPFSATYLKGRSNYVCLQRLQQAEMAPILTGLDDSQHFDVIRRWAVDTDTGDKVELTSLPDKLNFWRDIDARSDICIGQKCPKFDDCFITKARLRAVESNIIIVNHHLFFADLALRDKEWGRVLPDYDAVIFDEAHMIEDIAMTYFGSSINNYQIEDLVRDVNSLMINDVFAAKELTKAAIRMQTMWDNFRLNFDGVAAAASSRGTLGEEGRFIIRNEMFWITNENGESVWTEAGERYCAFLHAIDRLSSTILKLKDPPPEMEAITRRVHQLKFDLEFIVTGQKDDFVYWGERRGRFIYLHATPINSSSILSDRLFKNVGTVIMASATLTGGGSFEFVKSRYGVDEPLELVAQTSFDYKEQSILYLPPQMPDPREPEYPEAAASEIIKLLNASKGRAFVLCTSNASMNKLRTLVEDKIEYPVIMQGESSTAGLLETFRNTPNAVLFAVASFWQGVDVRGEALSCVIIDKLPFAVPTDPVVSARQRFIDNHGGNSFMEYSVPSAVISLKQGVGRLIRSEQDRGVIAILDPRLTTKRYGQVFLKSLPPCTVTRKIEDVNKFFGERS